MKRKRKQEEKKRKKKRVIPGFGLSFGITFAKTASPHEDAVSSKLTLTYISTIHQNYYKPKSQPKRMSSKLIILLFRLNRQDVIILIIEERSHLYAAKPGCII